MYISNFCVWPYHLGMNPQASYGNVLKRVKNSLIFLRQVQLKPLLRRIGGDGIGYLAGNLLLGCANGAIDGGVGDEFGVRYAQAGHQPGDLVAAVGAQQGAIERLVEANRLFKAQLRNGTFEGQRSRLLDWCWEFQVQG